VSRCSKLASSIYCIRPEIGFKWLRSSVGDCAVFCDGDASDVRVRSGLAECEEDHTLTRVTRCKSLGSRFLSTRASR
jgi:hypothetical protein